MNKEVVDYDTLRLIQEIKQDYGTDTCFYYIDSLVERDNKESDKIKAVICFVEPCGDIQSPWFFSWVEAIEWWIDVFKSQPEGWGYIRAGHHLFWRNEPTEKPEDMWKDYEFSKGD
jgi:hypothetical protein